MTVETHQQLANVIWSICDLLRGPYRRNEYRKVILPLTVLSRFDSLLSGTREQARARHAELAGHLSEGEVDRELFQITGYPFYNVSRHTLPQLLAEGGDLAAALDEYIRGFSRNVREIMARFAFDQQIARMAEKNLLYQVLRKFVHHVDVSPTRVDNEQMGYVFEELIRIGAEQSNEQAGEHFTPREVIQLMVDLLLDPDHERWNSPREIRILDPACGTGGILSMAEAHIRQRVPNAQPQLYGQDINDEAWAICKSDMLIKGELEDNIRLGNAFTQDAFKRLEFEYMMANPPFGLEWKQEQAFIEAERANGGPDNRFGAGLPRISDGSLLFLQHMLHKMRPASEGGSRIGIVFNGSPLFSGDAGSGESNIREWIIRNDWLEAVVALPDQLFYNTGISTYIWVLTNRKEPARKGMVQLIDARRFYRKMKKSLGNKRNKIGGVHPGEPDHIGHIASIHRDFTDGQTWAFPVDGREKDFVVSRVLPNDAFGYRRITVERPLRLSFRATPERIARLAQQTSGRKDTVARSAAAEAGERRREQIRALLAAFAQASGGEIYSDREAFRRELRAVERVHGVRLTAAELKAVEAALGERDSAAEPCVGRDGRPEPDPELRDTASVPLSEEIDTYLAREVLPHLPDAWVDHERTRVGYEIPFNPHFHRYEPPRPLEQIESEIRELEREIVSLLAEVTA
ncbi:MAG TPA: class I SAM-dependent DNA methyltransferase [Longimicrobium sp.]|nr:class I SAM-dependent DNA methyltransferase [Longimicrobium sp.]